MLDRLAMLRDKRDRDGGFTLIELLVVVVIIGILIAIAIPLYLNYKKGANDKAAESDLRAAITTLEQCNSDNSKYPASMNNTTGPVSADCDQRLVSSSGTYWGYWPSSDNSNYLIQSANKGGTSGIVFCYASKTGGSVTKLSGSSAIHSSYADSC